MVVRDISFYKYLEAAFRHKLFKDKNATSFNYLGYNLPYESVGAKKGIFEYARKILPFAYTNKFTDTLEGNLQMAKALLEKLDKEGKELGKYIDPGAVPPEYDLMVAQAQAQQAEVQPAPPPSEAFGPGLGLPTAGATGTYRTYGRKPVILEKETPVSPKTIETGLDYEGKPYALSEEAPSTMTSAKETSAQKTTTGRRFQFPKAPAGFVNTIKNFGSKIGSSVQIGIKKASTRLGSIGRAGGGMLGGAIGGGGRALGRFGLRAADVGANLSQQVSRGGLSLAGPKNKVLAGALIGGFLLFFVLNIAGGVISPQTTPSGQAAPVGGGPSYTGGGAGIVSCPLNDGRITCGSQNAAGSCNHCAANYAPYTCPTGGTTGRETAIDVVSSDRLVFLPFIGGGSVTWIIGEAGTTIDPAEGGGGIAIAATATTGGKTYRMRFVHIASTNLKINDQVPSGTLIGQYISTASHVHITIQENGEFKPADTYFKLCTK